MISDTSKTFKCSAILNFKTAFSFKCIADKLFFPRKITKTKDHPYPSQCKLYPYIVYIYLFIYLLKRLQKKGVMQNRIFCLYYIIFCIWDFFSQIATVKN